ncbi:MAG: response regulator [Myxococcaceae bacterium]
MVIAGEEVDVSRKVALLAVQDDGQRQAIAGLLREEGMAIVELEDGLEVSDYLELALGSGAVLDPPSLIVCDVVLEGRTGIEILLEIRGSGVPIPVLLVQGEDQSTLIDSAEQLGAATLFSAKLDRMAWVEAMDLLA